MSSRLELDTNVLKEKEQNYTSLTELNQLRLFTNDFETIVEEKKSIAEKEENSLADRCFTGDFQRDTKDAVISSMFYTSQKAAVEGKDRIEGTDHYFLLLGSILIGLLICILILEITNRGEKERHDADTDNRTEG